MGLQVLPRAMGSWLRTPARLAWGKPSASGWARAEKGCQLPHFQSKEIMKRNKLQQERLGPGTYNIRDFLQETRPSSVRGICDTREQRFRDGRRDCFPGPGTYDPQGNPYTHFEERNKHSASTRGLMDSRTAKCALPPALGSGLGPGTYNLRLGGQRRGTELSTDTVKGFLDKLTSRENKKKGCFSTLPRNPGCPTERIFWATLSQCPREAWAVGPGSYNPKPVGRSACSSQPPFWSSAKRFDTKSYRLFTGNEQHQQHAAEPVQNPVGVGRYDITEHEKYPRKMRYQSLYRCDAQRYLSNLKRDAYLLERLKPVAKNNRSDLISAPHWSDTSEEITAVFHT
ncbi:PREDICTED: uncharacterized protein C1orf177 homolog [Charadrius vociferus]|uniref:uncharacterized protein C1orf177 homolog n=1 Tax=Charadrius vociferus TaxID=50402 RepID=UPI000521C192|nr:PREDICTED: uncharacterized protein C1orf177 homolog [Charadrius vociferus]